ncbi:substrate-binding domain-containing protein [Pseudomonas sp. Hp2]|uniref:substrate-binding domain-containing protein n=1 Tax=Pseudomonas sp. Hp2 TaxID=701189 RepID=UPI00112B64E0|nr:substrate-binding domain-containing protein [Pseudomonas sp. Hp2]
MFKAKYLCAMLCALAGTVSSSAFAQVTIQSGGASIPASLYKGEPDSILPANFTYAATGSGIGKTAFLTNNASLFGTTGNVHFVGSDSVLSPAELSTYDQQYNSQDGNAATIANYGNLIQIPMAATPIAIPFNKAGGSLDLSVTAICGILSGKFTNWSQVPNSGRTGAITVVYRNESSGASEILTRFLTAACWASDVSGTTLKYVTYPNGTTYGPGFSVQSTFRNVFVNNTVPPNFISPQIRGDVALYNTIYAADGRIGYTGPDVIPDMGDATKVARIKGFSPNQANIQATLDTVAPPTGAAAADPAYWVPTFGNPSAGYPIIGYTNLILSQCYADATVASNVLSFLRKNYAAVFNNDAAIRAHGFIPLTATWKTAIRNRFTVAGAPQLIGDTANGCAGVPGRPL